MWRAYQLKEALRAIFGGDLNNQDVAHMLNRWCSWAQRSRLEPFIKTGRTIRDHRKGILAAISLGINNGRIEGLNNRVRLIVRRGHGFHTAHAALALILLTSPSQNSKSPTQPASHKVDTEGARHPKAARAQRTIQCQLPTANSSSLR